MKFRNLLLILLLAVGMLGLLNLAAAWPDPETDETRSDSAIEDPGARSADVFDESDSSRAEISELLNMAIPLSEGDIELAFKEAWNRLDVDSGLALVFMDSVSRRIVSGSVQGEAIDSAYLESIGARVWESMNTGQAYRPGLTVALVNSMREMADLQGEEDIEYEEEAEEEEAIAPILFALIIIILAAKLGGDLVERFHQPAVLGELIFGMILGNLALIGIHVFEPLRHHITIEIMAEIGVIILLFEVGLESSIKEMMSVGLTSFFVALIGVVAPFFLGWWVSAVFLPQESIFIHIFIGATLTATSVGITARVLKDIGKIRSREAKIILGAAVFDDIMGLVVLAVVVGIIGAHNTGGTLSSLSVFWIVAKAFIFILGSLSLGAVLAPHFFRLASKLRTQSVLITFSLMFCFVFAFLADRIGLAPIVGAFAAGMILSGINFDDMFTHEERKMQELLGPISAFLVPIFFVYMGMNVDLSTLGNVNVIVFALVLTFAAILGKQVCSLAGVFERKINSWAIGVGMIPRGEVGLIFAGIGAKLQIDGVKVVSPDAYSAVIIMVMITTLVTPPVLKTIFADRGQ